MTHDPVPTVPASDDRAERGSRWSEAVSRFISTETLGGLVLALTVVAALIWANRAGGSYQAWWGHTATVGWLPASLFSTPATWVNNGLMTVFFFAVGLEIGRERAQGDLAETKTALVPVVAALGGMAGAALVYLAVALPRHGGADVFKGWGVPMATDVAFTLGAIALLGTRVPRALRVFVLTLAVADDVASVIVLAVVGRVRLHLLWLLVAIAVQVAVLIVRRRSNQHWLPYVVAVIVQWFALAHAGIEPPLAGAFIGCCVPASPSPSLSEKIENVVHPLSAYLVLPLFVLANTGVVFGEALWHHRDAVTVFSAVLVARLVGKMGGIVVATLLITRISGFGLPQGTRWIQLAGVAALCGMGITVPLLFATVVFAQRTELVAPAQLALLAGTLLAFLVGAVILTVAARDRRATVQADI
jgi:Na+:H+ antiporter, NhaA family